MNGRFFLPGSRARESRPAATDRTRCRRGEPARLRPCKVHSRCGRERQTSFRHSPTFGVAQVESRIRAGRVVVSNGQIRRGWGRVRGCEWIAQLRSYRSRRPKERVSSAVKGASARFPLFLFLFHGR